MKSLSLEDRTAISDRFVCYMRALDSGDVERVVSCFTEDGQLDSPAVGVYSGKKGVREFATRFAKFNERGFQLRHVISNMEFEPIDESRVRVKCYLTALVTNDGKSRLLAPGTYDCRLRRENGDWLFEYRLVRMDSDYTLDGI
jgi:3-phenylpropionate/cinnamic acid dioxygenase small subunit